MKFMFKLEKNIFSHIMAENIEFGSDISSRKTGFSLKKLKVQPGNTAGI